MESFSNTQCILEELAFAADGGFLDEPNPPENNVASVLPTAITKLTDGWFNLVNNQCPSLGIYCSFSEHTKRYQEFK